MKADTRILNEPAQSTTTQRPTRTHDEHKGHTHHNTSVSLTSISSPSDEDNNGNLRNKINLRHKITRVQGCNKDDTDCRRCGETHYTGDAYPAQKLDERKQSRQKSITGGAHATEYDRKENRTPWLRQERKIGTLTRLDCEQRSRTDYDGGTQREPKRNQSRTWIECRIPGKPGPNPAGKGQKTPKKGPTTTQKVPRCAGDDILYQA